MPAGPKRNAFIDRLGKRKLQLELSQQELIWLCVLMLLCLFINESSALFGWLRSGADSNSVAISSPARKKEEEEEE